jgi:hypothetical protein
MSSRLDRDQESALITEIAGLQRDLNELRTRQSIARSLLRRTYTVSTAAAFDVNGVVIPAGGVKNFYFYAKGDQTQVAPYGVQYSQVYSNGTAPANLLPDDLTLNSSGTSYNWVPIDAGADYYMGWAITVNNIGSSSSATIYIKFRAQLSCKMSQLVMTSN